MSAGRTTQRPADRRGVSEKRISASETIQVMLAESLFITRSVAPIRSRLHGAGPVLLSKMTGNYFSDEGYTQEYTAAAYAEVCSYPEEILQFNL